MFDGRLVEIFCEKHLGAIFDQRYDDEPYEDGYNYDEFDDEEEATESQDSAGSSS